MLDSEARAAHQGGPTRRSVLQYGAAGLATVVGGGAGLVRWTAPAAAATRDYSLFVNDGQISMIDGQALYLWGFGSTPETVSVPGAVLQAVAGDTVTVAVRNNLDEPHAFTIIGVVDSGAIPPGASRVVSFTAPAPGTYLYADGLSPAHRVMGLHGALVVMPAGITDRPYVGGPRFRQQFVWVLNEIDYRFSQAAAQGRRIDPGTFEPQYFTINGRSGILSSHAEDTVPHGRVGDATLIRIVSAGMAVHGPHFHGNHVLMLEPKGSGSWRPGMMKDTFYVAPTETVNVLLPFDAPPDAEPPVTSSHYPMHDHIEMSQTAFGGNYTSGMVTDWVLEGA